MSIVSKQEFAEMAKMPSNMLAVYIKRGKVFVASDGLVNSKHEVNVNFLKKRLNKIGANEKLTENINHDSACGSGGVRMNIPGFGEIDVPEYAKSERLLKHLQTQKLEKEVKLLELREAKIRGEVVPSDVIAQIFLQHNHSILTKTKEFMDELLRKIGKLYDATSADMSTFKGEMVAKLNNAMSEAATLTASSVENVIKDYSKSRGVGERA